MRVKIHGCGLWEESQVISRAVLSTRQTTPALDALIDQAWNQELAHRAALTPPGMLFDGPMVRLEKLSLEPERVIFEFSEISYKSFFVLHMIRRDLLAKGHEEQAVRPMGVSALLLTADHQILLGQRSSRVAYHPNLVHPIAGSMEPRELLCDANGHTGIFATAYRELGEEVHVQSRDISSVHLLGVIEDPELLQPEAVLLFTTPLSAQTIISQLDPQEHDALISVPVTPDIANALPQERMTPVCSGVLALVAQYVWMDPLA